MIYEVLNGYYTANELKQFHSFDDEPAVVIETHIEKDLNGEEIEAPGYRAWYKDGQLHRENAPAVIHDDGTEFYYLEGNIQQQWE